MGSVCRAEALADSYLTLGEALAGVRGEPRGTELAVVQAFVLECGGAPLPISLGALLGGEARAEVIQSMAERGLVPSPISAVPRDSLAHTLVFMGLLAAAEAQGDDTASTLRLRLIDDILKPTIERLRGHGGYCEALLAEALAELVEEDLRCLGVEG